MSASNQMQANYNDMALNDRTDYNGKLWKWLNSAYPKD